MNNCKGECNSCKTSCKRCPVCHGNAMMVESETVKCILKDTSEYIEEQTYICLNHFCEVTYFNSSQYYVKDELKVPIWFKENVNDMVVCYCLNITLNDIRRVVTTNNVNNIDEIVKILGKDKIKKDCIHLNPIGKNCDKLFLNTIKYVKGESK